MLERWRRLCASAASVRASFRKRVLGVYQYPEKAPEKMRRRLLAATALLAGVGGIAAMYPLVASLKPAGRQEPAEPFEVDLSTLPAGGLMTLRWAGKPLWILRRTPEMLAALAGLSERLADPHSSRSQQPEGCANPLRSLRPEFLVLQGECTHLGCIPIARLQAGAGDGQGDDWPGGFVCPCHGATFDLAGRVFKNSVASLNLTIPPHVYLSDQRLLIGLDRKPA